MSLSHKPAEIYAPSERSTRFRIKQVRLDSTYLVGDLEPISPFLCFFIHKMGRIYSTIFSSHQNQKRAHNEKCLLNYFVLDTFIRLFICFSSLPSHVGAQPAGLIGACRNQELGAPRPQSCPSEAVSMACRIKEPESAADPFCASLVSGSPSPPGPLLRSGHYPFPAFYISVGLNPKYWK